MFHVYYLTKNVLVCHIYSVTENILVCHIYSVIENNMFHLTLTAYTHYLVKLLIVVAVLYRLFQHMPVSYRHSLFDIGQVINNLMGGAYQSTYCRKKFRILYCTLMNKVLIIIIGIIVVIVIIVRLIVIHTQCFSSHFWGSMG